MRTTPYHVLEKKATAAGAALEEVQKEFEVYRTEKCENERMLNEELKALRESLSESRAKAIKLASQVWKHCHRVYILREPNKWFFGCVNAGSRLNLPAGGAFPQPLAYPCQF